MGIPFYYRHLILKDQKNLLCNLHDCDRLFLDFNSVIHTCAQSALAQALAQAQAQQNTDNSISQSYIESMIFEEIYNHTISLTKICKPTEFLYIAIDGVAPRSKIHQQRKRRYLSAFRNELIYKFKDENNIPYIRWDSNAITPGTDFMKSLQSYLLNKFKALEKSLEYKIIFSGADEPGEGEHKIIRYIKEDNTIAKRNVIYGLDADLIMLSLTAANAAASIYLMREGQNFMTNMTDFKFLNIANLRTTISTSIFNMYDYIFICFLLGNDFVPNVACLKIKSGAIDIICEIYKETYNEIGDTLVQEVSDSSNSKYRINYSFLISLLNKLTVREDKLMVEVTKEFYETAPAFKHFNTKLEKFTYELDNNPQYNKFPFVIDPIEDTSWRSSYYHHLFGSHKIDMINNICKNYIEGLEWICDYYFNSHSNHNHNQNYEWYYRYNYAPCVSDLHKYLKINSTAILPNALIQPNRIKEDIQLLMVLPPLSKTILNAQQQKLMDDLNYGCVHYYPIKFCITSYLKSALWESLPVLPNIDLDHLIAAHETLTSPSQVP